MRVVTLLSGGKDSVAATYVAQQWGWDVAAACTLRVTGEDSHMFHRPNAVWASLVADAMGLPAIVADTAGVEDAELDDLEALLARAKAETGAEGVVVGAIASEYQRTRVERIGHRLGLKTFTPLWHKPRRAYLDWLVHAGFHIRFVAVAADGLDESWLGRSLTPPALEHLARVAAARRIDLAGEGGEYETLVVDGPGFDRPVHVDEAVSHWDGHAGWWEIQKAHLGAVRTT